MESGFYGFENENIMKTYTEEQVIAILDHIERKGFNDDCLTINDELDHLKRIGVVKNCSIPDVVNRRELLLDFADYSESDKTSQTTDECVDNYLDSIK
jgi:hypothetical protein